MNEASEPDKQVPWADIPDETLLDIADIASRIARGVATRHGASVVRYSSRWAQEAAQRMAEHIEKHPASAEYPTPKLHALSRVWKECGLPDLSDRIPSDEINFHLRQADCPLEYVGCPTFDLDKAHIRLAGSKPRVIREHALKLLVTIRRLRKKGHSTTYIAIANRLRRRDRKNIKSDLENYGQARYPLVLSGRNHNFWSTVSDEEPIWILANNAQNPKGRLSTLGQEVDRT